MGDSVIDSQFMCRLCPARFARLDHLQRHGSKHEGRRLCVCEFCNAQYHRRDILRRHYKTCKLRGDQPIPGPQKRGRRKQACDRCAGFKVACDMNKPCRACASSNIACSWTRTQAKDDMSLTMANASPQNIDVVPVISSEDSPIETHFTPAKEVNVPDVQLTDTQVLEMRVAELSATESQISPLVQVLPRFPFATLPVTFLINFISPESRTFPDKFGYSTGCPEPLPKSTKVRSNKDSVGRAAFYLDIDRRVRPSTGPTSNVLNLEDLNTECLDGSSPNSLLHALSARAMFRDSQIGQNSLTQHVPDSDHYGNVSDSTVNSLKPLAATVVHDPTKIRLSELIMQLTDVYITLPKGHPARTLNVMIVTADTFFTEANLQLFSQTYFHHFYPHLPIIHRPSFDSKTASLSLILVVFLAGALYSSLHDSVLLARSFLQLAEEYVFRNPLFQQLSKGHVGPKSPQKYEAQLQAVQAALHICFLQNWEGDDGARCRIRVERFGAMVTSARTLGLTSVQNRSFPQLGLNSSDIFDWRSFAIGEMQIRLIYYTFIIDNIFSVFHNYPPRLALAEMLTDMPCSEETFAAVTDANCFQSACNESLLRPALLGTLVEWFLVENLSPGEELRLQTLTTLQLFIVINALHAILWIARTNFIGHISIKNIDTALSRWKALWDRHRSNSTTERFKRLGFSKFGADYWWLAKLFVFITEQGLDSRHGILGSDYLNPPFQDNNITYVNALLRKFCDRGSMYSE